MKLQLTLFSIILLTACTVTKRHFEPGYHVEWKRNVQGEKAKAKDISNEPNSSKQGVSETHPAISAVEPEVFEGTSVVDSFTIREANPANQDQVLLASDKRESMQEPEPGVHPGQVVALRKFPDDEYPMEQEKQKVEPFTWAALAALFLAGMVVLFFFTASISHYILIFAVALGVVFIVFSIVSVTHIWRNPDKFKARGLSWTFFGISAAVLLLASLTMLIGVFRTFIK